MKDELQQHTQAQPTTQGEFERLIGEPVSSRSYVPKMELTAKQRRDLNDVRRRLLDEARMMGDSAYYGWQAGKDAIEGPSVKLAMAAARCWGNCSVEAMPLQETRDAYVFTSRFIDLETGYTLERQFRQSKAWTVYGQMDAERKGDIRFQIGQSKAARNLVLNALPEWLIDEALTEAKSGCREKVEQLVASKGIAAAVDMIVTAIVKQGVKEPAILAKCGVAKREGLKVDDIVMLRGCLKAIQDGAERASELFPSPDQPKPTDLAERAKAMAERDKAALGKTAEPADPPQVGETVEFNPQAEWEKKIMAAGTFEDVNELVRQATDEGFGVADVGGRRLAQLTANKEKRGERANKQRSLPGE